MYNGSRGSGLAVLCRRLRRLPPCSGTQQGVPDRYSPSTEARGRRGSTTARTRLSGRGGAPGREARRAALPVIHATLGIPAPSRAGESGAEGVRHPRPDRGAGDWRGRRIAAGPEPDRGGAVALSFMGRGASRRCATRSPATIRSSGAIAAVDRQAEGTRAARCARRGPLPHRSDEGRGRRRANSGGDLPGHHPRREGPMPCRR